jgi:tetratricopeptide (TPR) repeat protein
MRKAFAILTFVAAGGLLLPAFAQNSPPPRSDQPAATEPAKPPQTREERLNDLFGQLKRERNEKAAERIAGQIWKEWFQSGSSSIDLMMQWAQQAMEQQKYDVALDFLDEVITLQPGYAEGWNRRATVNFMMSNYAKSMSDIDRTLALEPRHFGALSGMAQILKNLGRKEMALRAYQRVLDIYPMMRSAQTELATLSEELSGEGI